MLIGYARISKNDGSQSLDLQTDALIAAGVDKSRIYTDMASGKNDDRQGLTNCLKSLREGDTLLVWKLDRLGRSLKHLINVIDDLSARKIGFRVLSGHGANIDTTTAQGRLVFGIFAALAEFERDLISERTKAGLASARARGREGGRPMKLTPANLLFAQAFMADPTASIAVLCESLKISKQTLYRHIAPDGTLREAGLKIMNAKKTPKLKRK
jgi:DNA invertase Pin-like site-specific DNA recombinase